MTELKQRSNLKVASGLITFIEQQALPNTGIDADHFWDSFSDIVQKFMPLNRGLIAKRDILQQKIDEWHKDQVGRAVDKNAYFDFLESIGYLIGDGDDFTVTTTNIDEEIASIAGPQLVVPITNARYAVNAANARWGSLYDALYGSDALDAVAGSAPTVGYSEERGKHVVAWGRKFLDDVFTLSSGSHADACHYEIQDGNLYVDGISLKNNTQFVGYQGNMDNPDVIILVQNGLHCLLRFDPSHPVGKVDKANIADIKVESALTTIMDCEDSVVSVDSDDKCTAYSNWLGLMKGDLEARFDKGGQEVSRQLASTILFNRPDGRIDTLKGLSLMLVRNVGLLMTTPAVLDEKGRQIPEEILDAMITIMIAIHDMKGKHNSRTGSIYIVKPKMHGPEEVRYVCSMFSAIENIFNLPENTVKIGIMDEERRTTINLKACIREAKERLFFINTGFLDRTGDEIHTSMHAGSMVRKADMKSQIWINAYEDWNVDIGLECGLSGKAQIGKGMWAMPDMMAAMLDQKTGHPHAGANCAWVPSPTAATLHATHYFRFNVFQRQQELKIKGRRRSPEDILTIPLAIGVNWSDEEITEELENNAQGILGYVVRWVDQGIGCSKVPDITDVGLMEDRATLRISSQHIANWLLHEVVTKDQVITAMKRMAQIVDEQNTDDPAYTPMAPTYDGIAFKAAYDLIFYGVTQPSGYTEPILHAKRLEVKQHSIPQN